MHFSNIVSEGEFDEKEVSISSKELFKGDLEFSKNSLQNSKKGGRPQKLYNLDAIISIGYRMNSKEATRFRIWSRGILKQYMRKGYVLNKELLINGGRFSDEYFEQLLEEIRDIRSLKGKYTTKSLICMHPHMTTIRMPKKPEISMQRFKTNCIMQF